MTPTSPTPDACHHPGLMPVAEALELMQCQADVVCQPQQIPLVAALDRILAEDIVSPLDIPPQDNAAMDGYALRAADNGPRQLIGHTLAGHPFTGDVTPGSCVRITTGAVVPRGADTVVMQENAQLEDNRLTVTGEVAEGDNIRRRGEDLATGQAVLRRGQRLGPVQLAQLASFGLSRVQVYSRLRVALLSTGDELIAPGNPLGPGQIYDSNRYGLNAMLTRAGFEVVDLGHVRDEPEAIQAAFSRAMENAQALVTSGGVSVGDADYIRPMLEQMGNIRFWKLAIKPGKPFAFGSLGSCRFFGLPGNPVSALVTLQHLALPLLRRMAGETPGHPVLIRARAASHFKKQPGRTDYQRALVSQAPDGELEVSSSGPQGSGQLSSFQDANAYAVIEAERGRIAPGEMVTVLLFDRFIE